MATPKMTKNQMRRAKKKERKIQAKTEVRLVYFPIAVTVSDGANIPKPVTKQPEEPVVSTCNGHSEALFRPSETRDHHVEEAEAQTQESADASIAFEETLDEYNDNPDFFTFKDVFAKFGAFVFQDDVARQANAGNQGTVFFDGDDDIPEEDEEISGKASLSKKKRKQMKTLSVAELKAMVKHPEVVEWNDVSSSDPRTLVQIKAQRNVVPVPSHWSLKREYLSSKRGIEKSAFRLPDFIAATGIVEMRDAVLEKEAEQTLKQKQLARVQPKMGKLDIDYQKLYDAFFRFQTKPELTRFGEVYYEGKEAEIDFQHFRPGELGDAIKEALGMSHGAPPPWLINQQRVGPPPSYPTLKIPGLNVPPPAGGSWGYHLGGWGKPPVDELNRPLYGGDVAGVTSQPQPTFPELPMGEPVDRTLWGELQPPDEEESDEEESESENDEGVEQEGEEDVSGFETSSGFTSTMAHNHGVETSIPGEMDLRKDRLVSGTETPSGRAAYAILKEQQVQGNGGLFGVGHKYDLKSAKQPNLPVLGAEEESRKRKKPGDVDAALDVDSLNTHDGISKDDVRQKFDEGRKREGIGANWQHDEDLADMIAAESRKRQRTEKEGMDRRKDGRTRH